MTANVHATDQPYGWTISSSPTDPFANSMAPTGAVATAYLWLACCQLPAGLQQGMAAAEFTLQATGPVVLATTPANNFLNAGGATNLLLAVGGCPCGPVVAANVLILALPGSICIVESPTGTKGTVDCQPDPALWGMDWIGLDLGGGPCGKGQICQKPVSVESASWGQIKGIYR
jgi:hypothetical protein